MRFRVKNQVQWYFLQHSEYDWLILNAVGNFVAELFCVFAVFPSVDICLYPDKLAWTRTKQIDNDKGFACKDLWREDREDHFDLYFKK